MQRKTNYTHGSLRFEKRGEDGGGIFHIALEAEKSGKGSEWGTGYGGIRYCRRCKYIDCIHLWEETSKREYFQRLSDFCYNTITVATCQICKCRISRGGERVYEPSPEAMEIIARVAVSLYIYPHAFYGSGWMLEFSERVSSVLKYDGAAAAERFVRRCLLAGKLGI